LENVFFIDGVNVTDLTNATTSTNLPYNFIKEIEVKAGGYQAEYGRALGGIVNVITRSGTNDFRFDGFAFLSNDTLSSPARFGLLDTQPESFSSYDFGFSIGGPIVKDKLWFFAAYNRNYDNQDLEIPGFGVYRDQRIINMFAGKLTWQATDKTNLVFSIFGDPTDYDKVGPADIAPGTPSALINPDPILGYHGSGGSNFSLYVRHFEGRYFMFEGYVSYYQNNFNIRGLTEIAAEEPLLVDQSTNTWEGGYGWSVKETQRRFASRIKASFFLGSHTLKAGLEFEDNSSDSNSQRTPPGVIAKMTDTFYTTHIYTDKGNLRNRILSLYVQDSWLVLKRLRLNLGIRWDGQFIIGPSGEISQRFVNQFQPRIGFVYQLGSFGSQKLYGSYGRFYQQLPVGFAFVAFGLTDSRMQFFNEDPRNPGASPYDEWILSTPDSPLFDKGKEAEGEHFDEFIIGYDRILGSFYKIGLRGIYRNLKDAFGMGYDQGMMFLGNQGKGELDFLLRPKRHYTALEFTLARVGAPRLNFSVSYVLAKSSGNYSGLYNFDERLDWTNNNTSYHLEEQMATSMGLLSNDRRHSLKLYGSYNIAPNFNLGTFCTFQTGTPLNEFGATIAGAPGFHRKCLIKRGSAGRTPNIWDVNFRLSYDLSRYLFSKVATIVILDILHAGNPRKALDFDQVKYQAVDEEGNQINPNPNFGAVIRYQPPMTVRLGIQLGF
jgi:hypothetical protein